MSRGNERQIIAKDDADYARRIQWIKRTVLRFGWELLALVVMPNHDHLFVRTPEPNLSAGMHYLNGGYAGYFNKRHKRVGHLFQGRYKAQLIESTGHYLAVSRYIHLNPVRALLVESPEQWPWSTCAGYFDRGRNWDWVDCSRVLREFGTSDDEARARYRQFLIEGMTADEPPPWSSAVDGLVLGSEQYVAEIQALISSDDSGRGLPKLERLRLRPSLEEISQEVAKEVGGNPARWVLGSRIQDNSRALAAYVARSRFGYGTMEVAGALGYASPGSVVFAVHKIGRALEQYRSALQRVEVRLLGDPRSRKG